MQITNTITYLDGSATVELWMTREEIEAMAKIGILEVLMEASRSYDIVEATPVEREDG